MHDLVCHIGLHKTASGTLQRQFFPACEGLNLLTTLNPAVEKFIRQVTRRDPLYFDPDAAYGLIGPELRPGVTNLLSNESLSGPPYSGVVEHGLDHRRPILDNLCRVFPNARAIIVLRRQDTLSRSLYRQYVKRGGTESIARFFGLDGRGKPAIMSLDRFCFSVYLRHLYQIFDSKVLVLTFEEFTSDQASFLQKLCQFLGVQRPSIELTRENSTRMGYVGMEVTRRLNLLMRSVVNQGPIPAFPQKKFGTWRKASAVEYIHDYWPGSPGQSSQSPLTRISAEILQMYREDNKAIDTELALGLDDYGYC